MDLSLEGIGIETASPLNIDENLQLAITIGECQINALGKVVYTRREKAGRFRSGIKFEEISERNRGIIKLYLEKTHRLRRRGRMNQTFETDRRKHQRLELANLVAYKNFDIEEVTETINISMGGMKIRTEFPIEEGESLDLSLRIGREEFKSKARVIYCNLGEDQAFEIGLRFEETSETDLSLLNQYISNQN